MAKAPAKTPAKVKSTEVMAASDFEAFAGSGLDEVTAEDLLVPRLAILQALSPQVKKQKAEYIDGAEEGMIADLGTGELYPDGLWFLPVHYRKEFLEWAPRDSGKGLVEIHSDASILDQTQKDDRKRDVLPNGNYIAPTAQFYGLNLSSGRRMSYVPMTSTQLKKARRWNTLAMGEKLKRGDGSEFTAPLWYRTYNLGSAAESNNDGDWFGWTIKRGLALPEITMDDHGIDWRVIKEEALHFQEQLAKGEAKADTSGLGGEEGSSEGAM